MLSVIVITKNEAANIRRCLESVAWADDIIVLDSGSDDNTVAIAREYTKKVFATGPSDWQGYGVQKQRVLAHATGEWVLNLDADESVDAALKEALLQAMASTAFDAYRVPIRMCFYGKILRYSSSPKRHIRLFKRDGANYSDDVVHEKIVLPKGAKVGQLMQPILHRSFRDMSHALYKMNRYSSYSAQTHKAEKKQTTLPRVLLGSLWMFFRCYVLQRGMLDGKAGLLLALYHAEGSYYRGIKQLYPDEPDGLERGF